MTIGARGAAMGARGAVIAASRLASAAPIARKCSAGVRASARTAAPARPTEDAIVIPVLALRPELPARRLPEPAVGLVVRAAHEPHRDPVIGRRDVREVDADGLELERPGAALVDREAGLLDPGDRAGRVVVGVAAAGLP